LAALKKPKHLLISACYTPVEWLIKVRAKTILVTGIPGVGKGPVIDKAIHLSKYYYGQTVDSVSLSEMVADFAYKEWRTDKDKFHLLPQDKQERARKEVLGILSKEIRAGKYDGNHLIIETPMTFFLDGKPVTTFRQRDIQRLHNERPFDYVVTVIDELDVLAERFKKSAYFNKMSEHSNYLNVGAMSKNLVTLQQEIRDIQPHIAEGCGQNLEGILSGMNPTIAKLNSFPDYEIGSRVNDWLFDEMNATEGALPIETLVMEKRIIRKVTGFNNYLVMLESDGPKNLVKMIVDDNPRFVNFIRLKYSGNGDCLTSSEEAASERFKVMRNDFKKRLSDYCVILESTLDDTFPNIQWFVKRADMGIVYFPEEQINSDMLESGTLRAEIEQTTQMAKTVVLIHPRYNPLQFSNPKRIMSLRSAQEFFEAIEQSTNPELGFSGEKYRELRHFLGPVQSVGLKQNLPSYVGFKPYSVAIDVINNGGENLEEDLGKNLGKHLLGQIKDKENGGSVYNGYWTLIGGKREPIYNEDATEIIGWELDKQALQREAMEETDHGIRFEPEEVLDGYRQYPVDFQSKDLNGDDIEYVRIYQVKDYEGKIKPEEDLSRRKQELMNLKWFTIDEILEKENVLPATRQYFLDLKAAKKKE